jgi:hypothetical protein
MTYKHAVDIAGFVLDLLPQTPLLIGVLVRIGPSTASRRHGSNSLEAWWKLARLSDKGRRLCGD